MINNRNKDALRTIITVYIGAVFFYQAFHSVLFFRKIVDVMHLDWFSPALAIIGIALLCIRIMLLEDKEDLRKKEIGFVIAIISIIGISIACNYKYGLINNAKILIWQSVFMLLIFPFTKEDGISINKKHLEIVVNGYLLIFSIAFIISITQFFTYEYHTVIVAGNEYSQGLFNGRLWGVFASLYSSSIAAMLSFYLSLYLAITKQRFARVIYIVGCIISITFILLTGTRSTYLGMIIALLVMLVILYLNKRDGYKFCWGKRKQDVMAAIVIITLVIGIHSELKYYKATLINIAKEANELTEEQLQENTIERTDTEGDITNNRIEIWKDYRDVMFSNPKHFIIGLSPGGYMEYIRNTRPNVYIVKHIRNHYPKMYSKGLIYDTHSAYLTVFVSTGLVGVFLFLWFFIWYTIQVCKCFKRKQFEKLDCVVFASLVNIVVTVAFDSDLFYRCTMTTAAFWILLGILIGRIKRSTDASEE